MLGLRLIKFPACNFARAQILLHWIVAITEAITRIPVATRDLKWSRNLWNADASLYSVTQFCPPILDTRFDSDQTRMAESSDLAVDVKGVYKKYGKGKKANHVLKGLDMEVPYNTMLVSMQLDSYQRSHAGFILGFINTVLNCLSSLWQ